MTNPSTPRHSIGLRGGLFTQLFLIIFLPLVVILLVVVFASLDAHQDAMRRLVEQREERLIRAALVSLDRELAGRLAALHSLVGETSEESGQGLNAALQAFTASQPGFDLGAAIFNANGATIAISGNPTVWRGLLTDPALSAPILAPPAEEGAFTRSSPVAGTEERAVLVIVPYPGGKRVAAGAFTVSGLAGPLLSASFPASSTAVVLIDPVDQGILYRSGDKAGLEDFDLGDISTLPAEGTGSTHSHSAGGSVFAHGRLASTGWVLLSAESWEMVESPLLRTTLLAPLMIVPVLLVALGAIAFGLRAVVRPLQSLEKQANRLTWGDFGALEEPVGGIEEVRRLQLELRHLAHKVQAAQQHLHSYIGAITAGQEEERGRLARELHDDTIQSLIALKQRVQLAQIDSQDEKVTAEMNELANLAEQAIENLRRMIQALRPTYLEELGLAPALEMLALEVQRAAGIEVGFQRTGMVRRIEPEVELALYRITQEALSNITRHSLAAAARVSLHFAETGLVLDVSDDGQGFAVPHSPAEFVASGHYGLAGMHERAELIGSKLEITSTVGKGSRVRVTVPFGGGNGIKGTGSDEHIPIESPGA